MAPYLIPLAAVVRRRPVGGPVHRPAAGAACDAGHASAGPRRRRDRGGAGTRRGRHPRRRAPGADVARPPARCRWRHGGRRDRPHRLGSTSRHLRRPAPADPRRPWRRACARLARAAHRAPGRGRGPARAGRWRAAAAGCRAGILPRRPGGAVERRQARQAADRRALQHLDPPAPRSRSTTPVRGSSRAPATTAEPGGPLRPRQHAAACRGDRRDPRHPPLAGGRHAREAGLAGALRSGSASSTTIRWSARGRPHSCAHRPTSRSSGSRPRWTRPAPRA